jgi:Putative Ig domain
MRVLGGITVLFVLSLTAFATTYEVGPGQTFASSGAIPWHTLGAGDTVRIHYRATPYKEKWVICRQGTAANPITVQGVPGPNGELPIISGDDATTPSPLNFWNEERGLIKIGGANTPSDLMPQYIVIENLDLRSARPGYSFTGDDGNSHNYINNAASIYVEKVQHLTIRNCILHDSGNGLFIGAWDGETEDVLVEGNYIYENGNNASIFEHNNYTAAHGIIFQFNRFGPLRVGCLGNNLKDRSAGTVIRYNWIEGGNRALDLVDDDGGGVAGFADFHKTYVYGNVLIELDDGLNSQVAHYGGDSGNTNEYRKGTLYFYNNTIISKRSGNTTLLRLSTNEETADVRNNIVYVTAAGNKLALIDGAGVFDYRNNWFKTGYVNSHSGVTGTINDQGGNITGSSPGFVSEASQDFHLSNGSAVINQGTALAASAGAVQFQYIKHQQSENRPVNGIIDMGAFEFLSAITLNPASLPSASEDVPYDHTITASGGMAPYDYSLTSGTLPSGLALSASGQISGTPATPGIANFTVTATDANSDTGNRSYSIQVNIATGSCMFCDDFNNGVKDLNWTYTKGTWDETGGELIGTSRGKADALTPAFLGCGTCTIATTLQMDSEMGVKVSLLGWYQDKKNYVELILMPGKNKIQFKQRSYGTTLVRTKQDLTLNAVTPYQIELAFDGTDFQVSINGSPVMTVASAGVPNGTAGFRIKKATARFNEIMVH